MNIIQHDLTMSDQGWTNTAPLVPQTGGVYLHFGQVTHQDTLYWIPLRFGQAANLHRRWFKDRGSHKDAFRAIKHQDVFWKGKPYIDTYPNYAEFFDQLRQHCPNTTLLLVLLPHSSKSTRETIEKRFIQLCHPVWEQTYAKRKRNTWQTPFLDAATQWIHNNPNTCKAIHQARSLVDYIKRC